MAGRTLDQSTLGKISNLARQTKILLGIATIIIAAFSLDLGTPHDFTAALFINCFAVFLCSKLDTPRTVFGVMAIVTALSIVGFYLKSEAHTEVGATNRLAIVLILWVTTILAYRRTSLENQRVNKRETLEREKFLRETFKETRVGIQIISQAGEKLFTNQALADMMGYDSADALLAAPRYSLAAPYERDRIRNLLSNLDLQDETAIPIYEFDGLQKDGTIIRLQAVPHILEWEGDLAIRSAFLDVSERQRAETALEDSERRYRDLIDENPLGIQISDHEGNRLMVNRALAAMLGYDGTEEVLALPLRSLLTPENQQSPTTLAQLETPDSKVPNTREIELRRKDGTFVPVQVIRRVLTWQGKKAIQRTFIDISERKAAEAALLESERQYRELFEVSTLAIRLSDENGNRTVNQALVDLLGYETKDELEATPSRKVIAPEDHEKAISRASILETENGLPPSNQLNLIRKDGSIVPVEMYWQKFNWNGIATIQRTYIDISERKKNERALQERDKTVQELRQALARAAQISTMGEISSVIAHELHQPLTAIANTANAAQRHLADETINANKILDEMLPLISQQAERAGRVIGGIRKMFEGGNQARTTENLDLIIDEACHLATNELQAENISITRIRESQELAARIDKVQIQQVIYNLLRNAFDALQDRQDKTIKISMIPVKNQMAQISVEDTGCGLSAEIKSTLFDPFITTKDQGMGMGLFTCQHIIESHGGQIWAKSDGCSGTMIEFTLPLTIPREKSNRAVQ